MSGGDVCTESARAEPNRTRCRACIDEGRDGCFVCQPEPPWCPDCNGYGSSLKESGDTCSQCGGTGLLTGWPVAPELGQQ
jgi:hypothetical protein